MKVLCVAEKPSISKAISSILSGGQFTTVSSRCARHYLNLNWYLSQRQTTNKYIKNYDFNYPQTNAIYTVTSVSGHLTSHDFGDAHRQWNSCEPFALFDAPIETKIEGDSKSIEKNLLQEARNADMLMIWTDCDREGEHIGMEVANVCRRAKRNIIVKRARFSAIIAQWVNQHYPLYSAMNLASKWKRQIHNAAQHPVELDRAQADAVEARTLLDLRIGAAFTRMQTFSLQGRFPLLKEKREPISYGRYPHLWFFVCIRI